VIGLLVAFAGYGLLWGRTWARAAAIAAHGGDLREPA
jgi:hypothetical protein